jgi:hypothetical protein
MIPNFQKLSEVPMPEKVYGLKTGMKVLCWVVGIICIPLIVTIPFAVLMIMLAVRARLEIHADKMVAIWVRRREIPFAEVTNLEWGIRAGGLMGALMGRPLHYFNPEGKKVFWGIMVNAYVETEDALSQIEAKTGLRP